MERVKERILIARTVVHTYNEKFAQLLYARLEGHAQLMEKWLGEVEAHLE